MPTYHVTDPQSGRRLRLTGDSPPTEAELTAIFGNHSAETTAPTSKTPDRSWTDTAVDALPLVGGTVGSFAGGGKWNPLGMTGAALGGAGGAFVRQIVNAARGKDVPSTLSDQLSEAGSEGLTQAGIQGTGRAVLGGAGRLIKGVRYLAQPGVAKAAAVGALEKSPIVGPMARGAVDAAKTQAGRVDAFRGARLVKEPQGLSEELSRLLEELRTSGELPESVGGSAKPIPSNVGPFDSRIANMNPHATMKGFESSLPDKLGTTVVRQNARALPSTPSGKTIGDPLPPELERALLNALRYGKQSARLR